MFTANCLNINQKGNLTIGNVDTIELANKYSTPLYVMDKETIVKNCKSYVDSINKFYNGNGLVAYASKAFACKEIYRIALEQGMGVDVVSGGELYTAMSVEFPGDKIIFHGNNKTNQELEMALNYGVGRIVVDNIPELYRLSELAEKLNKQVNIQLRIKPGVDAHTHDFIRTGQIDSKFGFALETGEALEAAIETKNHKNINLVGIHCHIGSQILDIEPFEHTAEVMLGFMIDVKNKADITLKELNLGGGFGIKYLPTENPPHYSEYMSKVSVVIKDFCGKNNMEVPFIILEPGRSIVGEAGITLYTLGAVKEIPNIRTYISVDGGLTDNPRYALYKSGYTAVIANKANHAKDKIVTIAGKCCESGDLLGENMPIQDCQSGDIVAVLSTGAYNFSMSSNYNRIPRPAVVMVENQQSKVIVKRQSFEDIIALDL